MSLAKKSLFFQSHNIKLEHILFSLKASSMERSDSEESLSEFIQPFASDSQKIMNREIDHNKLPDQNPLEVNVDDNDDEIQHKLSCQTSMTSEAVSKMPISPRPITIGATTSNSLRFFAKKISMSPNIQQEESNVESSDPTVHQLVRTQSGITSPLPQPAPNIQATIGSLSYIKSFFRRRALLQSQMSTESNLTTVSLPIISSSTSSSNQTKTLSDVTEQDLEEMFPRIPKRTSVKGYSE